MIRVDQFSSHGDLQWSFFSSDSDYYTAGNGIMNIISGSNGDVFTIGAKGKTASNPDKIFVLGLNQDGATIKNIAYHIQSHHPELTEALVNIGQCAGLVPSSTVPVASIKDVVLRTTQELSTILDGMSEDT